MSPSLVARELERILRHRELHALFQPIVRLRKGEIIGFEALIRGPSSSPLHAPLALFDAATRHQRLDDLEEMARTVSARAFALQGLPGKLFLNLSPASLLGGGDPNHRSLDLLKAAGVDPGQVVIEISEQYPLEEYEPICRAILHYREMGFLIAIDDLGAGYAGLRSWAELRPDFVKIDRHFIAGIDVDNVKQEFVRSILDIAHGLDCRVIAEGIETAEELRTLCGMGVALGQGFFLGRPRATPSARLPAHLRTCPATRTTTRRHRPSEMVGSLAIPVQPVPPDLRVEEAGEIFRRDTSLQALPVIRGDRPIGILFRHEIVELLAARYGRDLYGRRPVSEFMRPACTFAEDTPLERVSRHLTEAGDEEFARGFVITREGRYEGMGEIRDLLRRITEMQIKNARHANPLTQLPGNVPIYERIDDLLAEGARFRVAYCDLDAFKPYNDVYGYARGDRVLQELAGLLCDATDPERDFVGHVGGDDFVLILRSADWRRRLQGLLEAFGRRVPGLYDAEHVAAGGITAFDRAGAPRRFDFISLSIGVVFPDPCRCDSHHAVASLATEAKGMAKRVAGNSLFVFRRRGPASPRRKGASWSTTGTAACPPASLSGPGEVARSA